MSTMGIRAGLAGALFALGLAGSQVSALGLEPGAATPVASRAASVDAGSGSLWEEISYRGCVAKERALRARDASAESVRAECRASASR